MNEKLLSLTPEASIPLLNQFNTSIQDLIEDILSDMREALFFQHDTRITKSVTKLELTSAEELALSLFFYSCGYECYFGYRHFKDILPYRVIYVVKH